MKKETDNDNSGNKCKINGRMNEMEKQTKNEKHTPKITIESRYHICGNVLSRVSVHRHT